MIPEEGRRISGWALRELALHDHNIKLSHEQLHRFLEWGLLEQPQKGGWPREAIERIVKLHDVAAANSRLIPMARRVVYLRASDGLHFPVSPPLVRRALAEFGKIDAPYRKIRRAYAVLGRFTTYMASQRDGMSPNPDLPREWRLPRAAEWPALLGDPSLSDHIEARLDGYFHWNALHQDMGEQIGFDLHDVPLEERVLLLAVIDASQLLAMRKAVLHSRSRASGVVAHSPGQPQKVMQGETGPFVLTRKTRTVSCSVCGSNAHHRTQVSHASGCSVNREIDWTESPT